MYRRNRLADFHIVANLQRLTVNTTTPTPIRATQIGSTVVIQEDAAVANWPTTDLLVFENSNLAPSAISRRLPAGTEYSFNRGGREAWFPGDIVGYVQAVGTATSVIVDEQGQ